MNLKQGFRRLASRGGFWRELYILHDKMVPSDPIREVDSTLVDSAIRERQTPDVTHGTVLVPMIQGHATPNCYKYCILAKAFEVRGYEPIIPVCHKHLPLCHQRSPHADDRVRCDACKFRSEGLVDTFGLEETELTDLLGRSYSLPSVDADPGADVEYRGIPVSDYALASSRNILQKYHVNGSDGHERDVYQRFLQAAKVLVDAGERLFESRDFNAVIGHDAQYVYGGLFLALGQKHGVPAYSNAWAYNDKKITFGRQSNRMATPEFSSNEVVEERLRQSLTSDQEEYLSGLMNDRMTGENRNFDYTAGAETSIDLPTKSAVGMFTNLIWDDSLSFEAESLPDYFEWVDRTIEFFLDQSDRGLLIKTHPAEAFHGTNESVGGYIREEFGDLPNNIRLLPPDTDVDTYALIADIDAGLVYNSTVGLEMAYLGTPAVVSGITHYRDYGFTFDVESSAQYEDRLLESDSLYMSDEIRELARRYAYFLFVEKQIDFPYVTFTGGGERGYEYELHPVSLAELEPGTEPFDHIVDSIINDDTITRDTVSSGQ